MIKRTMLAMVMMTCLAVSFSYAADPAHPIDVEAADDEHAGGSHTGTLLPEHPASSETIMQAVWVIIIFVVMLAVLYPTAWKNVLNGLKAREERIRRDIAEAEAARADAEATLREYNSQLSTAENKVREMLNNATTEGERIAAGIRTHAQQEAEEIKEKAMRDIDAAGKQATQEIYNQAATLSTTIAEKILRRNLNADDQRELVNQSLEQLQGLKS